jgi:glycerophosphoryl diester phosphodiesterase
MQRLGRAKWAALVAIVFFVGVYLLNASWLAETASGRVTLIAQRGLHQQYHGENVDDRTCTAQRILPPAHFMIDNTLPAIASAFELGTDVVEVDVRRTKDQQFVLFHDYALNCRTNLAGPVADHTVAELKTIDVGYGYTADAGRTYPLRGKGIGMMPTLEDALNAHPSAHFLIQIKDTESKSGDLLVTYLESRKLAQWDRLAFFGGSRPLARLKTLRAEARTWSAASTSRCLMQYAALGWTGHVPQVCDGGVIIVPVTQSSLLWGWPNRFLARMRDHQVEVMLIGRLDLHEADFTRLDSLDELALMPPGFQGTVWTDRVDLIGPALAGRRR